ncbi:hypothetical protein LINPERPRIM_LOCUS7580, partial [Linum perenne]
MSIFSSYSLVGGQFAIFSRSFDITIAFVGCTAIMTVQDKHTPKEYKVLDGSIVTVQDKVAVNSKQQTTNSQFFLLLSLLIIFLYYIYCHG